MNLRHVEPDPELEIHVREGLKILFDSGAQVVFNKRLPGMGNSQILISVFGIEFWIIQSDGSISVLASPSYASNSWQSIESLLSAIDSERTLPPPPVYSSLSDLGSLLESRLQRLNDALSRDCFASTLQAARQAKMKEMIVLNPRAYVRPSTTRKVSVIAVHGIAKLIQLLIPKPKNNRIKILPVGSDIELERQVREEFDFVFSNYGAQINSNGRLRIMDFATVTFDVGNLRIRASRDRGSIDVSVAPIHAVRLWHSLGIALQALQENEGSVQSIPSSILNGAGLLLERDCMRLNDAFT